MFQVRVSAHLLLMFSCCVAVFAAWKNDWDAKLDFDCPEEQYISRVQSEFSKTSRDRRWDFECLLGFVGTECAWSEQANNYNGDMDFDCPSDSIVTGFRSEHSDSAEDRIWNFKCCKIQTKPGIDCSETDNINDFGGEMNNAVPVGQAIVGFDSKYYKRPNAIIRSHRDRQWKVKYCKFTRCFGESIEILDDVVAESDGERVVGIATSRGCTTGQTYSLNLRSTQAVINSESLTVTEGKTFTWNTAITVSASVQAGFLGTGATASFGVSVSGGGSKTFSTAQTQQTSQSEGNWALGQMNYVGPAGVIIFGKVKQFKLDKSNVKAVIGVKCLDGSSFEEHTTVTLESSTFGQTHFTQFTGTYANTAVCSERSSEECIAAIDGSKVLDAESLPTAFKKCFEGDIGAVSKR